LEETGIADLALHFGRVDITLLNMYIETLNLSKQKVSKA
jgi:hypothetical protein